MIAIKPAYDTPSRTDGTRILVDRIWPRGVTKQKAHVEKWMRELGPSDELRQFFGHDPARWREFRKRYLTELKRPETASLLAELRKIASAGHSRSSMAPRTRNTTRRSCSRNCWTKSRDKADYRIYRSG